MGKFAKPAGCKDCVLEHKGKGFCPDAQVPDAEYVIFGEAPGPTEIQDGKPFQGKAGFVLKNWLMRAVPTLQMADEKAKISYMNVLKCLPPEVQGRPYPKGDEKLKAEAQCSQYLDLGPAKVVVLCGESPQRYFFNDELSKEDVEDKSVGHDVKGVMGRIGREYEKDGRRWVFAPHPAYILRQPSLVQHGQNSLKIAANTEKLLVPEYVHWETALREIQ